MSDCKRKCPKCGVLIKNSTHYHRQVKRCGTAEHRVPCPFCLKTFSRKDLCQRHIKKQHPECPKPDCFQCKVSQRTFSYELALHLHEESCGNVKPKPFKCSHPGCGKRFTRKATMGYHMSHDHPLQGGGGARQFKRTREEEEENPDESMSPGK